MHSCFKSEVLLAIVILLAVGWDCQAIGTKSEDREIGKEKKTEFLSVEFKEGELPPGGKLTAKTFQAYVMSISGVSDATAKGMPSLVYLGAQELEIVPDKVKHLNLKHQVK